MHRVILAEINNYYLFVVILYSPINKAIINAHLRHRNMINKKGTVLNYMEM